MARQQNGTDYWDKLAERYSRSPVKDTAAHQRLIDKSRHYLSPRDRVLDLGCATGTNTLLLAPHVDRIVGVDLSPAMIGVARGGGLKDGIKNARFLQADFHQLLVETDGYDAITGFRLLHLIEDLPAFLSVVHKALKPGGVFVSHTVCLGERSAYLKPFIFAMRRFLGAPHLSFLTTKIIEDGLLSAGFEVVESEGFPDNAPARFVAAIKF